MVNLIQKYRPYGIAVTDLSAQLWCEKQLEFSLERGRIETEQMKAGKERHKDLHEEVAEIVTVEPKTNEDKVAIKLHNCFTGLLRLAEEGMTRELPVWGNVSSLFVVGFIDELRIESGNLILLDTKTRRSESMPSEAQKRTTRFQLMLYKYLFDSLINGKFTQMRFAEFFNLNRKSKISDNLKEQLIEPNVFKLSQKVFTWIKAFPEINDTLQVRYESQNNKKLIGVDEFQFNSQQFERDCNFVEEFWLGKRKVIPVGEKNRWKCNRCEFSEDCLSPQKNLSSF